MSKHTPGPWQWFERMPGRPYLATPDRGQLYVLGFERKGMQGAGPVFSHWTGIQDDAERERKGGVMEPGLFLRDGSMHPDARLIAAAPDLLAALMEATDVLETLRRGHGVLVSAACYPALNNCRDAIAKATGEQS